MCTCISACWGIQCDTCIHHEHAMKTRDPPVWFMLFAESVKDRGAGLYGGSKIRYVRCIL